jgi:ferritin-like metal-binding protein YciE
MVKTLHDQLMAYLADVHSIEEQALVQMRAAPKIAGDDELAAIFRAHLRETEEHERQIRARLEAHGGDPSQTKDRVARMLGAGMVVFARAQPDTPGKLVTHAFSYEHMELAAYDLLGAVARRAGDEQTVAAATAIGAQEQAMGDRLARCFDQAVEASLAAVDPDDLDEQLVKYLADAHAIEAQSLGLLEKGPSIAGDDQLARVFADHLDETRGHQASIEARLDAHDAGPSRVKDAALRLGALNWGAFFGAQPDTPAKLAGFAYAFEHLEIGAHEQLRRVAARADDLETAREAERILSEERAAAARIRACFDSALEASLQAQGAVS